MDLDFLVILCRFYLQSFNIYALNDFLFLFTSRNINLGAFRGFLRVFLLLLDGVQFLSEVAVTGSKRRDEREGWRWRS